MSHAALTQRYRPQTFADVAGQVTLKAILSRAAAEDRVAPAYLFSGTRGVGKTTIARIFAKALNCKHSPASEPCNECDNCRAITGGSFVDVVEIDAASNTGVDDIRSLRENVGYAPMSGRFKIFIIDEAHMLSKSAFNALLKTLEEPPARVTFIMATTEPHKFPPTIISRCQHYVFKRLSDAELEAHLTTILHKENTPFEEAALRLIVRRAAGSVRDAMSLLGQVLALGGNTLSETDTRMVLGLAGQELFFKLLSNIQAADCPALSQLVREMLDQGLDLGFFLRELSSMWRNLFLLKQSGEAARGVVDLPEAEVERWLKEAQAFEIGHIHAAWQMSLEGQRRVLTSLEPALALELLLLNLAMLPRLLSMEQISLLSRQNPGTPPTAEAEKKSPITEPAPQPEAEITPAGEPEPEAPEPPTGPSEEALPDPKHIADPDEPSLPDPAAVLPSAAEPEPLPEPKPDPMLEAAPAKPGVSQGEQGDWPGFVRFCTELAREEREIPVSLGPLLGKLKVVWESAGISLQPPDIFSSGQINDKDNMTLIKNLLARFCGEAAPVKVLPPPDRELNKQKLVEQINGIPAIQAFKEQLGAEFVDYGPWRG